MNVVCYPNDVLRRKADPVRHFDERLRETANEMLETMYAANGVGLAAPQVGLAWRMCVLDWRDGPDSKLVVVNPEIVHREGTVVGQEGCLSFPGIYIDVRRARKVRVRYQDRDGQERFVDAEGLSGRALQHEIDHLDGVLLCDKMSTVQRVRHGRALKMLERRAAGGDDTVLA